MYPQLLDEGTPTSLIPDDVITLDTVGKYTFKRGERMLTVQCERDAKPQESWVPDSTIRAADPEAQIRLAFKPSFELSADGDEIRGKRWTVATERILVPGT